MTESENLSNNENETLKSLVQLKSHNIALLFSNYLLTLNIESTVVDENSSFTVYCDAVKFDQAKSEFELFITQVNHPKYQQAAWQHGETIDNVSTNDLSLFANFKGNFFAHAGIITLAVFALCWGIFLASNIGWAKNIFSHLHFYSALSMDTFLQQPLRLIGPALFHFSWLHIVFNTMWWWQLGGSIEKTLGKGVLINLFLVSAIASNLAQFLVSGPNFGGLSGVVYALVGFVWWSGYLAPEKGLTLSKPIIGFLLFWLLLGFVDLLPVNVANTAHLVGLISGCLMAVFTIKIGKNSAKHE